MTNFKHYLFILFSVLIFSCTSNESENTGNNRLKVTAERCDTTRTSIVPAYFNLIWKTGDQMILSDGMNNKRYEVTAAGNNLGSISPQAMDAVILSGTRGYMMYPADNFISAGIEASTQKHFVKLRIPEEQIYRADDIPDKGMPTIGTATPIITEYRMRNVCSIIKVRMKCTAAQAGMTVSNIRLDANEGEYLNGIFNCYLDINKRQIESIVPSGDVSKGENGRNISLVCPTPVALSTTDYTEFYLCVPAGVYTSGMVLNVLGELNGVPYCTTYTLKTNMELTRSTIYIMTLPEKDAELLPTIEFKNPIATIIGTETYAYCDRMIFDVGSQVNTGGEVQVAGSTEKIYVNVKDGAIIFSTRSGGIEMSPSMWHWFNELGSHVTDKPTQIIGLQYIRTTNVIIMSEAFYNCTGIETLDLSKFRTSNVTDIGNLFFNCHNLREINLRGWNLSNVQFGNFGGALSGTGTASTISSVQIYCSSSVQTKLENEANATATLTFSP